MQEIDFILDDQPDLSLEMVLLDIRNRQAHAELQAYNEHKVFVYKHSIARDRKLYNDQLSELYELKRTNLEALLSEITNTVQNIRRIQSNLNTAKYKTNEEKEAWENNLLRSEMRKRILEEVIR